jgi:hypothetical protein
VDSNSCSNRAGNGKRNATDILVDVRAMTGRNATQQDFGDQHWAILTHWQLRRYGQLLKIMVHTRCTGHEPHVHAGHVFDEPFDPVAVTEEDQATNGGRTFDKDETKTLLSAQQCV